MSKNIILIIGASSDIGLDLIKRIDEEALVIAHYNSNKEELLRLSDIIKNKLVTIRANLLSDDDLNDFIAKVEVNYGVPEKIIHLAAPKFEFVRFKDFEWSNFQNEINISLKSIMVILNHFLPKMAKLKSGKIVIMLSSVVVNVPPKALSQYTTIKYAMLGLVKALASEYADKNIQINAISPSMVETKFLENINEKYVELAAYNHSLKRNAKVSEVTPMIKMLLSKDANYINGINIPITGGDIF